jgi:hypothetical protein
VRNDVTQYPNRSPTTSSPVDPNRPAGVREPTRRRHVLTRESLGATLATIRRFAPGTQLVANYMVPAHPPDAS